ncbi:LuxR family transcriptional regulator [Eggerthella sp. YY7918]|uniref:LuxR family transcriptional regulator n=1 Tax=Eggerthella sp. (strain YY7918) TaxID=502558 RepID=UPI0002171316|nr:LuxR family transcriptional regulator [Eggerthella sp. YY7918]BAK45324.1 hypothetical protein EGYY_22500 [Eggerthella sp. YY7918]
MAATRKLSVTEPIRLVFATKERRQALAAFVVIYAWEYLAFFSSTLTKQASVISPCLPEHSWAAAGLTMAVCSTIMLVKARAHMLRFSRAIYLTAALLIGLCSLGIWVVYTLNFYAEVIPYILAGLIGGALPFMYLYRIDHFPDLEVSFLGTFFGLVSVCSLLVYLVFILLPSPCAVIFCTGAPVVFFLVNAKQPALEPQKSTTAEQTVSHFPLKSMLCNCATAFILIIWLNFAFFRIIAAPWDFESRVWYYPSVFVTTLVVSLVLFLAMRKTADRRHQRGQIRFAIVAFAISYLILYVRYYNPFLATIAFAFCFACMIALEALAWSFWSQAVKRQYRFAAVPLLIYLMVKGVGISAGVGLGEQLCLITDGIIPVTAPLLFLIVLFACAITIKLEDFDKLFAGGDAQQSLQGYDTDFGRLLIADEMGPSDSPADTSANPEPPEPAHSPLEAAAENLSQHCALSPRETDVLRLLLAGRNRPFIKDALFISTGTVNSHISSIYRKTGVNSQQELISLAESLISNA